MKKLSEMTLTELWELFPIILEPHNPNWKAWYKEEEELLNTALRKEFSVKINHIGSTFVENIWAKPIVDILVEVEKVNLRMAAEIIKKCGYGEMSRSENRISFNKGYTENGFAEKVFHLHLRVVGDNAELSFRDYLVAHPQVAKEYEALKLSLWKPFEHDRDGYTESKTQFVKKYSNKN